MYIGRLFDTKYVPMHGYDMYDFGFRHYYATIGRFTSPDPLSERTPWQSPYVYASNNFTGEIDWMGLFGMSPIEINDRRQCIIINGEGTMIGGIDDGDSNIYVDVDGDWCISDGKEGLQCVGIMIAPFNYYYDRFIKFHGSWKAIGLYYNNIRLYGNVAIGINVSTMLKNFFYLGINIISFDLLNVTLTLDDDFDDDIDNYNIYYFAKNKECIISQGIGLALLSIEHSFKVRGGVGKEKDIRYISGTESYKIESVIHKNENDLYLNLLSIDDKGNWKISFGCSAIFQFNVSVQGNLYYQK